MVFDCFVSYRMIKELHSELQAREYELRENTELEGVLREGEERNISKLRESLRVSQQRFED